MPSEPRAKEEQTCELNIRLSAQGWRDAGRLLLIFPTVDASLFARPAIPLSLLLALRVLASCRRPLLYSRWSPKWPVMSCCCAAVLLDVRRVFFNPERH